jgi:AAA family ATP:ADP antiporter
MLYTVVDPEARYKAKNVTDTAVYRATDAVSGFVHGALTALGTTLAGFGFIGAGIATVLAGLGALIGRGYRRRGGT